MPPQVANRVGTTLPRVPCYNCDAVNHLDDTPRQWCRSCSSPLVPIPAWVSKLGWPDKQVPSRERRRMHHRARVPVKAVRFDCDDGRGLAGTMEVLARREGLCMNDLHLALLRLGLKHWQASRSNGSGGGDGG